MSDAPVEYMRYRMLIDHDAQCLEVADEVEFWDKDGEPVIRTVVKVERKRVGGRSVQLDNGFVFDPSNQRDERLRNMTIHRPLAKFRASAYVPAQSKHEEEPVSVAPAKTRGGRKNAGK